MLSGLRDEDPASFRRACERYPGWQIRTDLRDLWIAVRGGTWPVRTSADTLAHLVDQIERVELAECGELDTP